MTTTTKYEIEMHFLDNSKMTLIIDADSEEFTSSIPIDGNINHVIRHLTTYLSMAREMKETKIKKMECKLV